MRPLERFAPTMEMMMNYSTGSIQAPNAQPPPMQSVTVLIAECQSMAQQAHETLDRIVGGPGSGEKDGLRPVPNGSLNQSVEMLRDLRSSLDAIVARCGNMANTLA